LKKITIHTDGACEGNPGPGGWAAVLRYGTTAKECSGGEPATTNNRMEMQAAIEALSRLKEPCEIDFFTDSEYLKNGVTQWVRSWKARGWRTVGKKPIKNEDLWRKLDGLVSQHQIRWHWVKGHDGNPDNEKCDQLAVAAVAEVRKRFTREQLKTLKEEFEASRDPQRNQVGLL
jgi:ribonuclease HI